MQTNKILISLFVIVVAIGCKKPVVNTFDAKSFPLAVGNWWRYQQVDGFASITDTIVLGVVSMTVDGNTKDYTCQLLKNGAIIDSGHFLFSDTALYYHGASGYSYFGFFNLKLPFIPGQKWPGILPHDTIFAEGYLSKSGNYNGVYYSPDYIITRRINVPKYFLSEQIELTPGVGVIVHSIDIQSDTASWQQVDFTLIDYHVQ